MIPWHHVNKLPTRPIWMIIVWAVVMCQPLQAVSDTTMPFAPGERLQFHLRWAVVPAGKAVMEVLPMKTIDGVRVYHFRLTAKSNSFVDMFYKVRDRIDAYACANMTHAVRYRHKQHEGKTQRNVKVNFNWNQNTASYSDGKTDKIIEVVPGTFDPLSVFYKSRMADLQSTGLFQCPVSDGKKCVNGMARIVKKETITVLSGTYETYLLEPDMKDVGGVFEKDKKAKIKLWVTADERRLPVKIASKVAVGSFVGELLTIDRDNS